MDRWKIYNYVNRAIADVFFTPDSAGLPIYLDFDDDTLTQLGQRLKLPTDKVWDALANAVLGVLSLRTRHSDIFGVPLQKTREWLRRWQGTPRDERMDLPAPPVLTLLAVFSMAAERMGSDASMAVSNYFGPLSQLLRLKDAQQKERLATQYRQHVESFWNVLGLWLNGLDGMRGLPSAVALSHRYVGLSMSQALVREHDRSKLPKFFVTYGLDPGREVTPREIEPYLDEWMKRTPPVISRNLATLWSRQPAARERIASVVALELQTWDGSDQEAAARQQAAGTRTGEVRLVVLIRSNLFGRKVEFSLVAKFPGHDGPRRLHIDSAIGDEKPVLDFMPGVNGWHRLHRPADLADSSILDGVLRLTDPDGGIPVVRRPRQVLPMRKDEALGQFLEAERLQLAEDGIVFAFDGLADEVDAVLAQVARPGYRRTPGGQEGVPVGWTLFSDVQVLGLLVPEERAKLRDDLNVLQPSVSSQLTLAEGLKLPGRLRKYAVQAPPELRAVAVAAEHIKLEIIRKNNEALETLDAVTPIALDHVVCARESDDAALVIPLADVDLAEGDYEALLYVNRAKDAIQRLPFFLRSGDYVDLALWARAPRLAYLAEPEHGSVVLGAARYTGEAESVVDGVIVTGGRPAPRRPAPQVVWWNEPRPQAGVRLPATTLTVPDPKSCLVTRAHHWDLPYAGQAMAVEGTCRRCGLVKRFPNTWWAIEAKKKARDQLEARYHVDVNHVAVVQPEKLTWDVGLDALMHAGGGDYSTFERIALQIEGSLLFAHTFALTLESLGHVQIRRDYRTLEPLAWEISPSALAGLADGSYLLVGYWPDGYVAAIEEQITGTAGRIETQPNPEGPSRRVLRGLTAEQVEDLAAELEVAAVARAAAGILGVTPGLGSVLATLPRVSMPGARSVEQFHLGSSSWVTQSRPDEVGAYALESFGKTYVYRDAEDVAGGTARIGTANLVKHLAALQAGRPLVAYRASERALDVPLGAELPGLYGRAAVLCAGLPPRAIGRQRVLRYHNVPAEIAEILTALLTS
ncbi:hypothetical protein JIG36_33280 [Actinoplanes sp. LDG1-06]|uniref:Uncharacterized protein n=1 Tax=Paractinoplanes ovalisporus TaxID=2810368 RepID=A0ABS2AKP6_9ACTN|nr:hypothetical protein [Actinoplanes ovalisporus]MBM2620396.1 hypothetical protein [Actinoplanes ovalisporus]